MAIADFNHIKTVLNTLDTLRPARFGYTESAVAATGANEITALTGVYVPEDSTQVNSIPTPDLIGVDPLIVNIGLRAQAATLTRMTANHFFGRLGLNLLKVTEKTKLLVEDHLVNRYITPSGDIMEDVTIEYEPDEITLIKHKSPLSASAPITSSAAVSLLAAIYDGNAGVMTGADKKKLDDTAANLNLSGLTSGRLLRYNSVSGRIESATVAETSGALSGVTTLSMSGAITGATTTNTINGLIINSGALSGVTTLSLSDILTSTNTTDGGSGAGAIVTSGGIYAAKNIYSAGRVTGNTTTGQGVRGEASGAGYGVYAVADAVGGVAAYVKSTSGTALSVVGTSTFSKDATINGLTVGKGGGNVSTNTAYGASSLLRNVGGVHNSASGDVSQANGTSASRNASFGFASLYSNVGGNNNVVVGVEAGRYFSDSKALTTIDNSVFIGYNTRASANGNQNEIVIGYNALGNGSNSVTLGNDSITKTILQGNVGIGTTSPNHKLDVLHDLTNANNNIALTSTMVSRTTGNVSRNFHGATIDMNTVISSGVTVTGTSVGLNISKTRNNLTYAGDAGTITNIVGLTTYYGHNSGASAPITTNVFGINLNPRGITGTITNMYDIYLGSKLSGGTVTNHWGIYQHDTAIKNYFGGNVGIGTTIPRFKLEVRTDSFGDVGGTLRISNVGNTEGSSTALLMGYPHPTDNMGIRLLQVGNPSAIISSDFHIQQAASSTTWATRLFIQRSTGNVAIGGTTATEKLYVTGNIYATGTITAGSARALKENIVVSTINATEIIMKTDIMKFNYIADEKKEERIGFIADDTHEILAGTEHNKIDLTNSIGVLIKALQESNKRIELLEEKIRRNEVLR